MKSRTQRMKSNIQALASRRLWATVFLLGLTTGCGSNSKAKANDATNAPHVSVVKVVRRNLSSKLEIAGEFQPYQEINVYAKVSGYIQKLNVNWGTRVNQ